ncbi:uncharacterized protein N7511_007681 [Penicillium nucicola]|uniref:uncharacterized protein n=1 Tax=Penicillium nucicola TaxID=1850975 RepID=UPI002545227A|nr:uncharacterized protein N7511_007681 [Penicillium nucicola]KAJ5753528.1 hypothetical protein N7511_007681 [Penicillium nucicola]
MTNTSSFPFTVTEHIIDGQYIREYPRATVSQGACLKLAVKKYVPTDNPNPQPGDVTIIGAPGGGFPKNAKELYEPLWEDLFVQCKKSGIKIGSIWTADAANLGASGVVNEELLGNDPSWLDHSRDLLYMINQFRDEMPRPIIGVGHSMGAGQLVLLSLMHPRLFTSLALVEPVIVPDTFSGYGPLLSKLSLRRRDSWSSRSVAIEAARKSHKKWDERVFKLWALHGYRRLPTALYPQNAESGTLVTDDGPVTLTSTKHQEVMQYVRSNFGGHKPVGQEDSLSGPAYDPLFQADVIGPPLRTAPFYRSEPVIAWKLLDHVRPSVLYIFGGTSPMSTHKLCAEIIQRTGAGIGGSGGVKSGQVKEERIEGFGHQLPLEEVARTALALGVWIDSVVHKWHADEIRIAKDWADLPAKDRLRVSEEWMPGLDLACKLYEQKSKL